MEGTVPRGYAVSDEDLTIGIASAGAPIFDPTGRVATAISVGGLNARRFSATTRLLGGAEHRGSGSNEPHQLTERR
jgi:DNA-binding IclR family transcriptional regulator